MCEEHVLDFGIRRKIRAQAFDDLPGELVKQIGVIVIGDLVVIRLIPLSQGDQYVVSWPRASVGRDGRDGGLRWRERAV